MYRKILVPIDGSLVSNRGLSEATALAQDQGATLRLVHVLDELIAGPGAEAAVQLGNTVDLLREAGEQVVARAEAAARKHGLRPESVIVEVTGGRAADAVVAEAKAWGADLIVLGTHGRRGAGRLVMGSDAEEIVRTTPVPVLLVRTAGQVIRTVDSVTALSKNRIGDTDHVQENPGAD